jgi:biotin operon repressor
VEHLLMAGPRYCIFAADALDDLRVTDLHLRVLAIFGRAADRNGWLQASQNTVAKRMGRTRETINRVIRDLVEWGYLRKKQRFSGKDGRQMVNDYQVVMDRAERAADSDPIQPEIDKIADPCDPPVTGACDAHVTGGCDAHITGGVTSGDHTPCDLQGSHHKNDPFTERPLSSSPEKERARAPGEFERFWSQYPHKVGKRDAARAYAKARSRAPFAAIMAGLARYAAKTDDRPWCNPSTFLNQDRWADQPAPPVPQRGRGPPRQENFADFMNRNFGQGVNRHDHHRDDHTGPTIDASVTQADRGGGDEDLQRLPVFRLE